MIGATQKHSFSLQLERVNPVPYLNRVVFGSKTNTRITKVALAAISLGCLREGLMNSSLPCGGASLLTIGLLGKVNSLQACPKPKSITSLEQLTTCDLSEVEMIELSGDEITSLPDELNAPKLKIFTLQNTKVKALPSNFNDSSLVSLDLRGSPIEYLPDNFNPPNLVRLDLTGTQIKSLPTDFNPPKLKVLYLSQTPIKDLPKEFNPPHLEVLYLDDTCIDTFPKASYQSLKLLSLRHTPIKSLPSKLELPELEELDLRKTLISTFSDTFQLKRLRKLNIEKCKRLTKFPNSILELDKECKIHLTLLNFPKTVQKTLRAASKGKYSNMPQFELAH